MMKSSINVLSINGGGIKGLIVLRQLVELEKITKVPLHQHFDYMVGTSTGGIIITLLSIGYSAKDILELYTKYGYKIFEKKFLRFGLFRPKYDDSFFNFIIKEYTKGKTLVDCKCDIIVPAYNISKMDLELFKSIKAKENRIYNHYLFDIIRATASAPSYFKPYEIEGDKYVDGGLVINNPTLVGLIQCIKEKYSKIHILSFSTGTTETTPVSDVLDGGSVNWVGPTINILLTEMDQTTDYFTKQLFELSSEVFGKRIGMYVRCESYIDKSSGEIDDVSEKNMKAMLEDGSHSAKLNKDKMRTYIYNTLKNE